MAKYMRKLSKPFKLLRLEWKIKKITKKNSIVKCHFKLLRCKAC